MYKKLMVTGMVMLMTVGLAACNGSSDTTSSDDGETKEVLKVSYPTWWENWFKDLEKDFESSHEDVNVELVPIQNDIATKQAMMMKSEETSPDVAVEDTFILNSDVNAGYLSPMDDIVEGWEDWGNFEDTIKRGVTAEDGGVYGIPFSTDVQGLWYNKEIFANADLPEDFNPESWEEILSAADAIKQTSKDVTPLFMYVSKATGEATSMRTFQVLYSGTGSELYDFDEKKWVVDEVALRDTFGFIHEVFDENLGPSLSLASNNQIATQLAEDLMMNNKVGMVMDGNWVAGSWREGRNKPWPEALETWGFIPFPTQNGQDPGATSMSGGWALSIPAKAQQKDLAAEFIKMAVDEEHQLEYVKQTGDMTVRTDVAQKDEYLNQPVSNYKEAGEILENTNFRPAVDDYPKVSTHIQEVVEAVATGGVSPEQAVENYEIGLKRIVGEDKVMQK